MTQVAFIGLGVMGAPMARRLIASRFATSVYDVRADARAAFSGLDNCRVATSPADAAAGADYLFTMLPESSHVDEVLFGMQGAAQSLANNALVVEMSTGDPRRTMAMAESLEQMGKRMIDCPVGRTPADAKAGTLLILVGGSGDILEEARPMLACFGDEIVHVGPFGSAIKLKLVNNYMTMVGMVMTAETLMFGRKLGLDRDMLVHVLQNTVAGRGQINVNFPKKVLAGDLSADFPLRLGLKDLSLALDLAKSAGAPLLLGGVSRELFALAAPWGRSEQDCTAMLLLLEDIAHCDNIGEVRC
ncbi:MAG: NAD(P)-dependent oxidoreductase [Pseudomonadota bacterium]